MSGALLQIEGRRAGHNRVGVVLPTLVIIVLGLCAAVLIVAAARPSLQGSTPVLLGVFPQPAYYPEPFVVAQGSMLANTDPDTETEEEKEDEAEGKELSDMETEVDEETAKNFPFPEYAKPVHAAKVDQFGRILENGNCAVDTWDTHNLWPHKRFPESDADEYATLHSEPNMLIGTTYNFPQNPECLSSPKGTTPEAVDYRANNWGYRCFSNGKCAIFQNGKAEDGQYDEEWNQLQATQGEVDGIAKDNGFWVDQPSKGYRNTR